MVERIQKLDWPAVREDVRRFLPPWEQEGLKLLNSGFFLYQADQMAGYLTGRGKPRE